MIYLNSQFLLLNILFFYEIRLFVAQSRMTILGRYNEEEETLAIVKLSLHYCIPILVIFML